ncbi:tRNA (adenosine(37)-N6)-dimethylallyltransferase MiaA [Propionibacterium sp.]|uniref:tRNA (adenosine(37)-N6)-dimethylallyltransferase MiaA n=1 Tax=Propionibacterium sp. TaxID=1977903 RepID=UPI0039ED51C8
MTPEFDAPAAVPPLVVIIGPTASGKSSLAVRLALGLAELGTPAEIVNADSMAIYRGMDIGTAKPTAGERALVRHHLVDIFDIRRTATVAQFQVLARQTIAELRHRGVIPLLVGGSSLYTRAVMDDFEFPGTDPEIRSRWEAELDRIGPEALHAKLAERAPQAAAAILPGNSRRVVRALEVLDITGHFTPGLPPTHYLLQNVHQFGLELERETMDERIAARVRAMFDEGLVDEVRELETEGLREGVTASRALGYRQVLSMLDGDVTLDQAITATIERTRRFARKQLGWFRRDSRICWLPAQDPDLVSRILAELEMTG